MYKGIIEMIAMEDAPKIRNPGFQSYIREHWSKSFQRIEDDGGDIVVQYPDVDAYARKHGEDVLETRLEGYMQGSHGEYSDINVYVRYTVLVRWTFSTIDGVIGMVDEQMRRSFGQTHPEFNVTTVSNPAMAMKPQIMALKPVKAGFSAKVKMQDGDGPDDYIDVDVPVKKRPRGKAVKVAAMMRAGHKVKGYTAHRRNWDAIEENRALQLRNQNVAYKDIATVLNRTESSIFNKFYKPKTWSVEEWVVRNAVQRAKDIKAIADMQIRQKAQALKGDKAKK